MTIWGAVLRMLGVAAVLLVLCFGIIQAEKDEDNKKYDERQQAARGKGCRFCFWVGTVYFTGVMAYLICGAAQLLNLSNAARRYEGWPLTGKGSVKWAYLAAVVTFFLLAASHLVATLRKEKE